MIGGKHGRAKCGKLWGKQGVTGKFA